MEDVRVPFNKAFFSEKAMEYVAETLRDSRISGDGYYTKKCSEWMEKKFGADRVLMTTSCTAALEMSAMLLNIGEGDEVIMPSYTFVTTASAFALRGAKPVFVDIRPDTMNIDETLIESAITDKTAAIVVVHYGGVACEMDTVLEVAQRYNIPVVEDAAQGVMATYKGKYLGTMGTFGCYSFHETKNYTMGEGGALVINNQNYIERAEILREKGTNRSKFYRGEIDKYTWVDIGSSYLQSEINVAYLYGQLEMADEINNNRIETWNKYYKELEVMNNIELAKVPNECVHNGHLFYLKVKDKDTRKRVLNKMKENGIGAVFHYVPLHSSIKGKEIGIFCGKDVFTTKESERIIRLPMYYNQKKSETEYVLRNLKKAICEEYEE